MPGNIITTHLSARFLFSKNCYSDLSRNFLFILKRLGEYQTGDEKRSHFTEGMAQYREAFQRTHIRLL